MQRREEHRVHSRRRSSADHEDVSVGRQRHLPDPTDLSITAERMAPRRGTEQPLNTAEFGRVHPVVGVVDVHRQHEITGREARDPLGSVTTHIGEVMHVAAVHLWAAENELGIVPAEDIIASARRAIPRVEVLISPGGDHFRIERLRYSYDNILYASSKRIEELRQCVIDEQEKELANRTGLFAGELLKSMISGGRVLTDAPSTTV